MPSEMAAINYIESARFINGICCKLTYLAAILDATMDIPVDFRLSDYQGTIYMVLMDY